MVATAPAWMKPCCCKILPENGRAISTSPFFTDNTLAPSVAMMVCLAKLARTRASALWDISTKGSTKGDAAAQSRVELLGDAFESLGRRIEGMRDRGRGFLGAV